MIGRLHGFIIEKQPPFLVLDVGGVGYEVLAPMSTFYHLPKINEKVTLLTHLLVREDAHLLYGFYQEEERQLFRILIKVNGVGPKLALTVLSAVEPGLFVRCVQEGDASRLVNIPGIGKKTAERLIIETRGSLAKWDSRAFISATAGTSSTTLPASSTSSASPTSTDTLHYEPLRNPRSDAVSALVALGYKPAECQYALSQIDNNELAVEELIRMALKQLMKPTSTGVKR